METPMSATAPAPSGYSGTPLAAKLGIAAGSCVLQLDAPAELHDWLQPLPAGVEFVAGANRDVDIAHVFVVDRGVLARRLAELRTQLRPDATLWVSWPKKSAKVATDITEDTIRAVALPLGWVDVKVCAVSAVWSGLKLVVRKELR
jgi:hypothetical protein